MSDQFFNPRLLARRSRADRRLATAACIAPIAGPWIRHWSPADFGCLSALILHLAKDQSYAAKLSIAFVIINRTRAAVDGADREGENQSQDARSIRWYCQHPLDADSWETAAEIDGFPSSVDKESLLSARAATDALLHLVPDPTHGADHWHKEDQCPPWSISMLPTAKIGRRWFYRLWG